MISLYVVWIWEWDWLKRNSSPLLCGSIHTAIMACAQMCQRIPPGLWVLTEPFSTSAQKISWASTKMEKFYCFHNSCFCKCMEKTTCAQMCWEICVCTDVRQCSVRTRCSVTCLRMLRIWAWRGGKHHFHLGQKCRSAALEQKKLFSFYNDFYWGF